MRICVRVLKATLVYIAPSTLMSVHHNHVHTRESAQTWWQHTSVHVQMDGKVRIAKKSRAAAYRTHVRTVQLARTSMGRTHAHARLVLLANSAPQTWTNALHTHATTALPASILLQKFWSHRMPLRANAYLALRTAGAFTSFCGSITSSAMS